MKNNKRLYSVLLLLMSLSFMTGCWNYREIESVAIVAGMAIDQEPNSNLYSITAEVIEISLGEDANKIGSILLSSEGETLFDAARNLISLSGERLYWSHAKVLIVGQEIAESGITRVLDFISRDAETRYDIDLIVAEGKAADIFLQCHQNKGDIISFMLTDTLKNEKSLSKAPMADEWEFVNDLQNLDRGAIIPLIRVIQNAEKKIPKIEGTGIFAGEKMVGFLSGEETVTLLYILDRVKGGLIIEKEIYDEEHSKVSLEVFNNKTKIKTEVKNQQIHMSIHIQTEVAISENTGDKDFNQEENLKELTKQAETEQEEKINNLISKVKKEYGVDIFGFGMVLHKDEPNLWDLYEDQWDSLLSMVDVDVSVEISVRNTGFLTKPIKVGD